MTFSQSKFVEVVHGSSGGDVGFSISYPVRIECSHFMHTDMVLPQLVYDVSLSFVGWFFLLSPVLYPRDSRVAPQF